MASEVPSMHLGIDIGGTKTDAVAIDENGQTLVQFRLSTGYGANGVLSSAEKAVRGLAEQLNSPISQISSIGVGVPGRVDSTSGRVVHAVNLGVEDLNLGAELSGVLGREVHVENDVNAAAIGAYYLLNARGWPEGEWPTQLADGNSLHSMAYLNLGTGLAAGIVIGGALWRGSRGTAGEIGHIPIDPLGPVCSCGQSGCLEVFASGSALARQWPTGHPNPTQHLFEAAAGGDSSAIEIRSRLVESIASAVRILVLAVDVEVVVIGGGIAAVGEPLLTGVRAVLSERAQHSPFLSSLELADRICLVPAGVPISALGAAFAGMKSALSRDDQIRVA